MGWLFKVVSAEKECMNGNISRRLLQLKRNNLGRVQQINILVHVSSIIREELHGKLPLWEQSSLDGVVKIDSVEVIVLASNLGRLVVNQ